VSVPQSLSALSHCLTVLSIQKNGLRSVPEPILLLESLRELELQDNQIERVGSLERLCKLKDLNLNRNLVKHLDLRGVSELNSLNMCSNRLAQVPSPLPLTLRFLCLSENQIAKLEVENFVELKRIDTIMLDDNRLSDLPVELAKLTSLTLLVRASVLFVSVSFDIFIFSRMFEKTRSCQSMRFGTMFRSFMGTHLRRLFPGCC
jgi:Leucine-rich repeat (LRR) protein